MERYTRKHDRHQPRTWWSLYLRFGGWASLILGIVLVVLTLISTTQLLIADRLDRDGKFARAVVIDTRVQVSRDSDGDETRSYYATFRFKDARTGGQDRERSVDQPFYDDTAPGDEVMIRYLESDPTKFEYEIGQYRQNGNVLRWVGLVFGLAGLGVLWWIGGQASAAILTRRDGEKRFAEVLEIRELSLKINNKRQARLVWREPDGQVGESLMRDLRALSGLYKAGDEIAVFRLGDEAYWEGDVGPPAREVSQE